MLAVCRNCLCRPFSCAVSCYVHTATCGDEPPQNDWVAACSYEPTRILSPRISLLHLFSCSMLTSTLCAKQAGKTVLFMSGTSKIKNENPDDFATYLAKRQAAAEGRVWTPDATPAPAPAPAAVPAAAAPADSGTSKIKNENPDDFATYMAKRQAAAEGRMWTPEGSGTQSLDAYLPSQTPVPAQSGPRSGDGKWVAPDSYATRTLSRDAPYPGSQQVKFSNLSLKKMLHMEPLTLGHVCSLFLSFPLGSGWVCSCCFGWYPRQLRQVEALRLRWLHSPPLGVPIFHLSEQRAATGIALFFHHSFISRLRLRPHVMFLLILL